MLLTTIVQLCDVAGQPSAMLTLPGLFRIGDRVKLGFKLRRQNGGRSEILDASGEWKVTAVGVDGSTPTPRQLISVESTAKTAPVWKAVKKTPLWTRTLPPARAPKTVLT